MQVNYHDVDKGGLFCCWAYRWMKLSVQFIDKRKANTGKTMGKNIFAFWG